MYKTEKQTILSLRVYLYPGRTGTFLPGKLLKEIGTWKHFFTLFKFFLVNIYHILYTY